MSQILTDNKYEELVAQCDLMIKSGQIGQASNLLKKVNMAQVPRESRLSLAKICRRAGLIGQGLRLLHPIIRHEKSSIEPATANEVCEYSALLSRNGSIHEALELLEKVETSTSPEALLYLGYCNISKWEYGKSAVYLESFLKSSADPYVKLVARVNLISSYIVISKLTEAAEMLNETIPMAEQMGATRLTGNCYELWGQVYFWQGDYAKARQALKRALGIFDQTQSYDQLLINKTESIMTALEQNSVEPLIKFRQEALARMHWESVREADLFLLKVRFEQKKLDHLIYGTPMSPYRQRIQLVVGASPSEMYILGQENTRCLDLGNGQLDGSAPFSPGKKIHHVLSCLVRDFYSPRNVGTLFAELYPDEYFDINSSPFRIRQLMLRTRQWLKGNGIPATILQSKGAYRLCIEGEFGIKMEIKSLAIDPNVMKWEELKKAFSNGVFFSADQACSKLSWSRTSFRRLVDWALQNGEIQRSGNGRSTLYGIISSSVAHSEKIAS